MYDLGAADYVRLSATARRRAQSLFGPERLAEEYVKLASTMVMD